MARLLTGRGEMICHVDLLHIAGELGETPTAFIAVVSQDDVVLRKGLVTVETDEGTRYVGHVRDAEAFLDLTGPAVQIFGMLGPIE